MSSRKFWTCGTAILAAALALRLACFVGVRSVEPVLTAWQAHQIVSGSYAPSKVLPESVNGSRFGIFLPTAAAIAVLGVNDRACAIFPLMCGLGLIVTVLAVLPLDVLRSTQLYTDLPMSLCWTVAAFLYWRALDGGSNRFAMGAGLAVGLSWLMREPGLLMLGVLAAWSVAARRRTGSRSPRPASMRST